MPFRLALLVLLFLLVAAELFVVVRVADGIGVLPTLLLLLGLGVAGMALVRRQGLSILGRVHASVQAGRLPVADVFEGVCILVAGLLLALPGLLTDLLGGALLLPPVRRLLYKALSRRLGRAVPAPGDGRGGPLRHRRRGGALPDVIEGEYEEIGPPPADPPPRHPPGPRP